MDANSTKTPSPNGATIREILEVLKSSMRKADEKGIVVDKTPIELAIAHFEGHQGIYNPEGIGEKVGYHVGQGIGMAYGLMEKSTSWMIPSCMSAGFHNGRGKVHRAVDATLDSCSEKASELKEKARAKLDNLKTRPAKEETPKDSFGVEASSKDVAPAHA